MLEVVAIGPEVGQRWRRQLAQDVAVRLGRIPQEGWDVPWDLRVSREHADLRLIGDKLQIRCLKTATNAVYVRGEPFREVTIEIGDDFRIGETTFRCERVPDEMAIPLQQESPTRPDPTETNVIGELGSEDFAELEATLSRFKEEAEQATELADQRFSEILELRNELDALRAAKPSQPDDHIQEEIRNAKRLSEERAAEVRRLKEENELLNRQILAETEKSDDEHESLARLQNQLAEAQTCNERLQASVAELTQQRDVLEAKVNEAVQLANKESELNTKQTVKLRGQTEELQRQLADISKQRDESTARTAELDSNLSAETARLQTAEARLDQTQADLDQATARLNSLESKIRVVEGEREKASQSLQEAVARIQREKNALERLNSEREDLKSDIDTLTSRMLASENSLRTAKQNAERLEKQSDERLQEIEALQEVVSDLRGHFVDRDNDLRVAQAAVRERTDDAAKLRAEIASLKIDLESLNEQIQNGEASLEIVRIENREQADEVRQLRKHNEGLQDEVESLRSQVRLQLSTLRKAEFQAQHEAQEAKRFKDQNESLRDEAFDLKRRLEGSSITGRGSVNVARGDSQTSAKSTQSKRERSGLGGTDETIDERVARPSKIEPEMREFGQYRILEKVGQGGMGAVYKAVHTRLDKVVALKLLKESRAHSPDRAKRFDREMKAIGRLEHENLVRAIDAGEDEDCLFLVMEYVDGLDVSNLVKKVGQLSFHDACEIVRQSALGMEYVHRRKMVHRDLKPSNLMLTRSGRVKILDLGLAQLNDWSTEGLTQSGQIMGTLDYMAPEQAGDSRLVDHRADIYSLGCTFFEMLAGRSPFGQRGNESFAELILAHATRPLPSLVTLRPEVVPQLAELVDQMTAKQPEDRPQAMNEIAQRLEPLSRNASLSALLATAAASSRRRTRTTAANEHNLDASEKDDTAATGEDMMGTRTNSSQIQREPGSPNEDAPQPPPRESTQSRE